MKIIALIILIIAVSMLYSARVKTARVFAENERDNAIIEAKRLINQLDKNYDAAALMRDHGNDLERIVSYYEQAGLFAKRWIMPFWLFRNNANGIALVQIYKKMSPYIEMRREGIAEGDFQIESNPYYCKNFEYLYERTIMRIKIII
jgi:hypothetical protein